MVSYLQNDNKKVLKIWPFTKVMAGLVTRPKPYRESIAYYQDKSKCLKTPNSLNREDPNGDSKGIG